MKLSDSPRENCRNQKPELGNWGFLHQFRNIAGGISLAIAAAIPLTGCATVMERTLAPELRKEGIISAKEIATSFSDGTNLKMAFNENDNSITVNGQKIIPIFTHGYDPNSFTQKFYYRFSDGYSDIKLSVTLDFRDSTISKFGVTGSKIIRVDLEKHDLDGSFFQQRYSMYQEPFDDSQVEENHGLSNGLGERTDLEQVKLP